jgi:hypothetical protein
MILTNFERLTIRRADLEYELELLESDLFTATGGLADDISDEEIALMKTNFAELNGLISQAKANAAR